MNRTKSKRPILVGIDPAFRKNGFCVCIIDNDKTVRFKTFKNGLLDFMNWLPELPHNVIVAVENSNLQNATFESKADKKANIGVRLRKSRNVGANQAASQYTYDACVHYLGKNKVLEISPRQKGVKWGKRAFAMAVKSEGHELMNYTENQDKRDAYKLALQGWTYRHQLKSKR